MSDQDTIFNTDDKSISTEEGTTSTGDVTQPVIPALAEDLIGEGKKYKDVEAALSSIPHADNHIRTLEAELADLRHKDGESKTVDDILKSLSNQQSNEDVQTRTPDENEIADKAVEILTNRAEKELQSQNIHKANDDLIRLAGDKEAAVNLLTQKATTMGINTDDLMVIAAKSPDGFIQLFATTQQEGNSESQPSQGSVDSSSFRQDAPKQGTYHWWQQQKKDRGINWYNSPTTSKQRLIDAETLGRDKFFNS